MPESERAITLTQNRTDLQEALKKEIKRKVFHFFSILYTLGYIYFDRFFLLKLLTGLWLLEGTVELGRFFFPSYNEKIMGLFGGIHREEETRKFSGIFWTLLGSLLTMWLFKNRSVVLCSMGYLILGDAAAALVGVQFGKTILLKGKSLEGSLAFMVASFTVGIFFFPFWLSLLGAVCATLIELSPLPFNDNLWVPVLSAWILSLFT